VPPEAAEKGTSGATNAAPDPSVDPSVAPVSDGSPASAGSGAPAPPSSLGAGTSGGASGEMPGAGAAGSSAATPPPAPAAPPPPLAEGEVQGHYSVPVVPELENYATFDVPSIRIRQHGSDIEIAYTLPELLVGDTRELSFRGSSSADANGVYQLSGDNGQAHCQWLQGAFVCDEALSGVEIDREKLQREYANLPAPESDARWRIATQFSDDPIGKLTFPR
jgi:hypothetical protein